MAASSTGKKLFLAFVVVGILVASAMGGALADRLFVIKPLDYLVGRANLKVPTGGSGVVQQTVVPEENVVIDVADKAAASVVTVSIKQQQVQAQPFFMDPFGFFGGQMQMPQGQPKTVEQDIGSGFVVDGGLIVTNKHVVSDSSAEYKVIDKDNNEHKVEKIYRDPANDLAILQVEGDLPALALGDSGNLKVGQFVVAIGTALGEFRHTVTTGVISGLGRGVQAGDGFGGYVESLDNVIQTDAAINPGNSGGPLIDSNGRVIGINTAVSSAGQNIGFAIPINVLKDSLTNFEQTGKFDRAFLGVRFQMIPKETAILNDVPAGAYLRDVVDGSSAADAGLQAGDIVTKVDGKAVDDQNPLEVEIGKRRPGDKMDLSVWRDGKMQDITVTLKSSDTGQ